MMNRTTTTQQHEMTFFFLLFSLLPLLGSCSFARSLFPRRYFSCTLASPLFTTSNFFPVLLFIILRHSTCVPPSKKKTAKKKRQNANCKNWDTTDLRPRATRHRPPATDYYNCRDL